MKLKKLIPVSVIGVAALGLAGCGVFDGDGDDGPSITQSQLDAAIAATAAAIAATAAADAATTAAEDRVTTLEGELATANAEIEGTEATDDHAVVEGLRDKVTRLEMELMAASDEAASDDMDVTRLDQELMAARDALTMAQAKVMELEGQLEDVRSELTQFKLDAADVLTKADKDERIAREAKIRAAIEENSVAGAAKAYPLGITEQAITRDAAGAITVDVNGATEDDYSGGATTAGSGDWNHVTMTKANDDDETMDTLVIYTDIKAPTSAVISEHDAYTGGALPIMIMSADGHQDIIELGDPPTGNQVTGYSQDDEFDGTWRGIPGTYTCTTLTCSTSLNDDEEALFTDGNELSFDPDSSSATYDVADTAYTYFGWWLNKPEENTETHDVEVFAGGTENHAVTVLGAIEGTASYVGSAAGKYATQTSVAGTQTDAAVGHFTADASLKAKFGDGDDKGSIEGSVRNFVLDDGTSPSWSVTLESISLETDGDYTDGVFNGTTEVNFGSGSTATEGGAGTWQGSFYGDTDAAADDDAPGTVAGTFDARTPSAAVIGGFGATLQ